MGESPNRTYRAKNRPIVTLLLAGPWCFDWGAHPKLASCHDTKQRIAVRLSIEERGER